MMIFMKIDIFTNRIEFSIYTLIEGQKEELLQDKIIIPKSFDIGNKLSYIRRIIKMLIKQYNIKKAHIEMESNIGIEIIESIKLEGVVEELLSNCGVEICK